MIPYPVSELADRYTILCLKAERLSRRNYQPQVDLYASELSQYFIPSMLQLTDLMLVNGKIWDLEADIRQGKEGQLGLEEVGRRALAIRDLNKERVRIKNEIAKLFGEYEETKGDHASA